MAFRIRLTVFLLAGVLIFSGCNVNEYPDYIQYEFRTHGYIADNKKAELTLEPDKATQLNELLKPHFGIPAQPVVRGTPGDEMSTDDAAILTAPDMQLDDASLKRGSILYRQHCLYCHGINGDGGGPTGQFLNPRPRDFRTGLFKFRSTAKHDDQGKVDASAVTPPSRSDLLKTLRHGVPTASMPSFTLLPETDLNALVSYVIHLSLRGQTEIDVAKRMNAGDVPSSNDVGDIVMKLAKRWQKDSAKRLVPKPPVEGWDVVANKGRSTNWQLGRQIYLTVGGCVQCHGKDGSASAVEVPDNLTRLDSWGYLNPPRNLHIGVYRGGSRPIDIFYRIKLGIAGSGMPAAADFWQTEPVKPGEPPKPMRPFTDEEIWSLVDYVMSMPAQRAGAK